MRRTRPGVMIRRLREEKGWSQVELARRARVSQPYLSQIEAGTRVKSPGIVILRRLAKALGVPVAKLLE